MTALEQTLLEAIETKQALLDDFPAPKHINVQIAECYSLETLASLIKSVADFIEDNPQLKTSVTPLTADLYRNANTLSRRINNFISSINSTVASKNDAERRNLALELNDLKNRLETYRSSKDYRIDTLLERENL